MKITVELSNSDIKEICQVTGRSKIGPAISKLLADAILMHCRQSISKKFISGQWGVELAGFEAGRIADRRVTRKRAAQSRS